MYSPTSLAADWRQQMTYHRTGGKGGTRNSKEGRHPTLPNFNKKSGSSKRTTGKTVKHHNPGPRCKY